MSQPTIWAAIAVVAAGCGGAAAERPLDVPVGVDRDQLAGALRRHEYCARDEPVGATEVFPRCDVPGAEHGQSWVVAHYEDGRVVRVQRWERYAEEARGLERFNRLVEQRSAAGPPAHEAKELLARTQELPAGTKTWVAFLPDPETVVAIYLLEPRPPQHASVLEEIVHVGAGIE